MHTYINIIRYGLYWNGPETTLNSVAEQSAATDLLQAAAASGTWTPATEEGRHIGFGGCVDDKDESMPQCYSLSVSEQQCRGASSAMDAAGKGLQRLTKLLHVGIILTLFLSLSGAVGYQYSAECYSSTSCRIFSRGANQSTCRTVLGPQWMYLGGTAEVITKTTGDSQNSLCIFKTVQ